MQLRMKSKGQRLTAARLTGMEVQGATGLI